MLLLSMLVWPCYQLTIFRAYANRTLKFITSFICNAVSISYTILSYTTEPYYKIILAPATRIELA